MFFACFSASSDVIHSNKFLCVIFFLYNVFIIATNSIYALYGNTPKFINILKNIPLYPDILGEKFFCFSSPSFFTIKLLNISKKFGKIIGNNINIANGYILKS